MCVCVCVCVQTFVVFGLVSSFTFPSWFVMLWCGVLFLDICIFKLLYIDTSSYEPIILTEYNPNIVLNNLFPKSSIINH